MREAGLSASERARNRTENDLKSMGFEAQFTLYSGPFAYKEKSKILIFHVSIFPPNYLDFELDPTSSLGSRSYCEYSLAAELPA